MGLIKLGFEVPVWTTTSLAWRQVLEIARAAVDVGFDSLWVSDHLLLESTNAELRQPAGLFQTPRSRSLRVTWNVSRFWQRWRGLSKRYSSVAAWSARVSAVQLCWPRSRGRSIPSPTVDLCSASAWATRRMS